MKSEKIKKGKTVLIVLVFIMSGLFIFNSDFIKNVSAQNFTITDDADFDAGVKDKTTTSTDRYNQTAGQLELQMPIALRDSNMVGYWRYENDYLDQTDNNNDGSCTNCPTYTASGKYGGAYNFDGVNDNIQVADNNTLDITDGTYSVSLWINVDTISAASDIIIYHGQWANSGWYFEVRSNPLFRFIFDAQAGIYLDSTAIVYDVWYHVALVCDSDMVLIYVNGTVDTVRTASVDCTSAANGNPLYMGWTSLGFDGLMDEIRIYNDTLTPKEVEDLWNWDNQYFFQSYPDSYTRYLIDAPGRGYSGTQPQAYYRSDLSYYVYLDTESRTNYNVNIRAYNHTTDTWSLIYNVGTILGIDGHKSPSLGFLPSGQLMVFYDAHNTAMRFKVSDSTHAQIEADMTLLANWGSATLHDVGGQTYNQVMTFSDQIVLLYRLGASTGCPTGGFYRDNTTNGYNWQNASHLKVFTGKADGCHYMWFTQYGNRILMTGNNYTESNNNRSEIYFAYSDDKGITWNDAEGTSIAALPMNHATTRISEIGNFTHSQMVIQDENDMPIIISTNDVDVRGTIVLKATTYNKTLGSSGGVWNTTNITDDGSNVLELYAFDDTRGILADTNNDKPTFWGRIKSGNFYKVRRYNRADNNVSGFNLTYTDSTFGNTTINPYSAPFETAPDDEIETTFSVQLGEDIGDGRPEPTVYAYGISSNREASWESGTITMAASSEFLNLTITHEQLDGNHYISEIEWILVSNGTVMAENTTDIISGASTTLTTPTWGDFSDVDVDYTLRIYLVGNGTTTPIITEISGYHLLLNTAPSIDNCPTTNLALYRGQQIDYEFTGTDADGDTLTWSISVRPIVDGDWLNIGSSTGILDGSFGMIGSYSFTITVEDPSAATDTCAITIDITNQPEDPIVYPTLPGFDFECRQLNGVELNCWITETGGIPWDRLDFIWTIGNETHKGWNIIHTFDNEFTMGETARISLTMSYASNANVNKEITKTYESNHISLWWIVLLFVFLGVIILFLIFREEKKKSKKGTSKRPSKLKALLKSVGWTGALLLGIAFVWLPTGTPDDVVTTLPLIMILGFSLWLVIGVIIIIACVFLLGKKLIKIFKYGL